jgi:phosphatidylserine/phosphatidylglycerophosphate/cardiolipin synthase-like enzyme
MTSGIGAGRDGSHHLRGEQLILWPGERREAVLRVIQSAQNRLILSLFRCDDSEVLHELGEARRREVRVQALLTRRAKGGKKRLRELWTCLEELGAEVACYADSVVKYHAKYIVADDGPALVASMNLTRKCFEETCDFVQITYDPEVVSGLQRLFAADSQAPTGVFPEDLTDRLIVGPEQARTRLVTLFQEARASIRIIDPKLRDPEFLALLKARDEAGIHVDVLDTPRLAGLRSHGKMILVDDTTAVIGSLSLSALSLGFRRELALKVSEPHCVGRLNDFFRTMAAGRVVAGDPGELTADDEDDEDLFPQRPL